MKMSDLVEGGLFLAQHHPVDGENNFDKPLRLVQYACRSLVIAGGNYPAPETWGAVQGMFVWPSKDVDVHPRALPAALAAQCANEQGQFWLMHDKIFENQENITDADLKRYAVQIGLNSLQFGNCFAAAKYLGEVQQDFNQGLKLGVKSTPTFFINGIGIPGAVPLATLEQIVVAELNR